MIYPMCAMVLLTAIVLVILFRSRVRAVREGAVSTRYFRTYQGEAEPEYSAKPSRQFTNLFEAPTLFYVVCLAAMIMHFTGAIMQLLAWLYVVARYAHAYVHLGPNRLKMRIPVYFVGWLILLTMWIYLAVGMALL